jgi:hypothetical protein
MTGAAAGLFSEFLMILLGRPPFAGFGDFGGDFAALFFFIHLVY